jgi:phosphoribosylformimino-5-aminoimidazole carboxamide ribotide isomerase
MDVIPAIDIRGGRCVQLVQGDYARETIFGDDPVAMVEHWAARGARRLHVVDLDGAKDGHAVNGAAMRGIIAAARMPVQIAGGVRDEASIDGWLDAGADRVVVGTLAVEQPDVVARAAARHGERIAVAVDARDGRVAVRGWRHTSDVPVARFIDELAAAGVRHFIYTDIARDGMLAHIDFAHVAPVAEMVAAATGMRGPAPLIYAGGVTSVDDLLALAPLGIEGAISGTALYERRFELEDAQFRVDEARD